MEDGSAVSLPTMLKLSRSDLQRLHLLKAFFGNHGKASRQPRPHTHDHSELSSFLLESVENMYMALTD